MTIHLLVDGSSEVELFMRWLPRVLQGHVVKLHRHQGKGTLPNDLNEKPGPKLRGVLDQLPAKLRGFAGSKVPSDHDIVVLIDADDEDPPELARRIREAASQVAPALAVTVCLAIEETEAFYLGDLRALKKAFPGADMALARAYEPDSICGTWEFVGQVVGDGGGNKVAWAEAMGPVLTTRASESRSPSFKTLLAALRSIGGRLPREQTKRKVRRHVVRARKTADGKR